MVGVFLSSGRLTALELNIQGRGWFRILRRMLQPIYIKSRWSMQAQREQWATWAIEKKVGAGFGFALALLLILGLISYQTTLKLDQSERDDTPIDLALDKLD